MRFPRRYVLVASLILLGTVAGCPGGGKGGTTANSPAVPETGEASAEDLLKSAIHQLRPENYSIAAALDKPVNLLNSWSARATNNVVPTTGPSTTPAGWIDDAEAEQLQKLGFVLPDAFHISDAMLNHTIATYLAARDSDDVGRLQVVFDYVVRNIALRRPDEPEMPLGIYGLHLFGSGTAEDRAWVCAELFRQLRIDCVIVRPSGDAGADADSWLLGVLLNGHVYLFDPRLGLAVPSTADAGRTKGPPATLAAIVRHPEWLQSLALRADQPYPIDAESLRQPEILPIVEPAYWSDRMKRLESVLPAEDLCVLFDPLNDEPERPGLLSRLGNKGPGWKVDQLKPWPYPRRRFLDPRRATQEPATKLAQSVRQAFEVDKSTFDIPFPILVNGEKKSVIEAKGMIERGEKVVFSPGHPERKLLSIRTDQLLGRFDDATKRYLSIRHLEIEPALARVPQIDFFNRAGAENAFYWTCVCKFESRDFEAAIEQIGKYLKRYDRNGRWTFAARALLAECHAELGQFELAAAALDRTRSDDPYRAANTIRIKRWTAKP